MKRVELTAAALLLAPPLLVGLAWGPAPALLAAAALALGWAALARRHPRRPWPTCRGGCGPDLMRRVDVSRLACGCGREYRLDGDLALEQGTAEVVLARRRPDRSWGEWQVEP